MKGAKAARVGILKVFELFLEQNVLLRDVAVHERDFGLVGGVVEDGADELVHGGYAGAASDEADVVVLVGRVRVFGNGAFHLEELPRDHVMEMGGHGAVRVAFDDEIEEAFLVCILR